MPEDEDRQNPPQNESPRAKGRRRPWREIRLLYVQGEPTGGKESLKRKCPTQEELSRRYDIPTKTIADRCQREQWTKQRSDFQDQLEKKIEQDTLKKIAKEAVKLREVYLQLHNALLQKLAVNVNFPGGHDLKTIRETASAAIKLAKLSEYSMGHPWVNRQTTGAIPGDLTPPSPAFGERPESEFRYGISTKKMADFMQMRRINPQLFDSLVPCLLPDAESPLPPSEPY